MVKMLLIDDEPLECEAIRFILERERPQVKVVGQAGSGRVGLNLARELKPDIVFMDIQMPGMSGLEATRALKEAAPGLKVVVLTAYDEFDFAQRALKLGASDYLLKPARPQEILRVVDKMCLELAEATAREEEDKRLRRELEAMMPLITTGLVLDLVSDRSTDLAQMEERARFLGLTSGPYQVLLVDIDHFAAATRARREVERQVLKKDVYEALLRTAQNGAQALVTPMASDTFLVLAQVSGGNREGRELAEKLRAEVASSTPCTVTVGVGTTCADLAEVPLSYAAAQRAVQYGSFFGSDEVVVSSDLERSGGEITDYPYQLEMRLVQNMRLAEAEPARAAFRELWQRFSTAAAGQAEIIRAHSLELAGALTRAAMEGGAGPEVLAALQRASLEELAAARTARAVEEWVWSVLERCLAAVQASQAAVRNEVIGQAKCYINEHFRESVSLEDVAKKVHLSPFHLSRLFKEKEGVNFMDYLTQLRLEEGKKLLARTNDTVAAIAERVGYAEANYFSRIFRRHFGMSPGEYRQQRFRAAREELWGSTDGQKK
ncbi:MAG: response regulator [Firmicutes bacterium]|nr:response regulator [Bacillota bacterium]